MHAITKTTANNIKKPVGEYLQTEAIANLTSSKPSIEPAVPGASGVYPANAPVEIKIASARKAPPGGGTVPVRVEQFCEP